MHRRYLSLLIFHGFQFRLQRLYRRLCVTITRRVVRICLIPFIAANSANSEMNWGALPVTSCTGKRYAGNNLRSTARVCELVVVFMEQCEPILNVRRQTLKICVLCMVLQNLGVLFALERLYEHKGVQCSLDGFYSLADKQNTTF